MAKVNFKKKGKVAKAGKKSYNQGLEVMAKKIAMLEVDHEVLMEVLDILDVSFNVQMKTLDIQKNTLDILIKINNNQEVMNNYV